MPGLLGGYCETDAERAAMEQYDYDQWRAKEDADEFCRMKARIAELEAHVDRLQKALLPFVVLAGEVAREAITSPTDATSGLLTVRYKDLRLASAAYHDIPHDGTPDDPAKASF